LGKRGFVKAVVFLNSFVAPSFSGRRERRRMKPSIDDAAVHAIGWPHDRCARHRTAHDRGGGDGPMHADCAGAPSVIDATRTNDSIGF
jgi:hypothetical protein